MANGRPQFSPMRTPRCSSMSNLLPGIGSQYFSSRELQVPLYLYLVIHKDCVSVMDAPFIDQRLRSRLGNGEKLLYKHAPSLFSVRQPTLFPR